jgi:hypothetical protein
MVAAPNAAVADASEVQFKARTFQRPEIIQSCYMQKNPGNLTRYLRT